MNLENMKSVKHLVQGGGEAPLKLAHIIRETTDYEGIFQICPLNVTFLKLQGMYQSLLFKESL